MTTLTADSDSGIRPLLFIAFLFMTCFTHGCRKEKDIRRLIAENNCKAIIDNPSVPERRKKLARKVIDGWNNKVLDPEPILVHAGYFQDPNEEYGRLFLTMSDEEYDIAGFGIKEFHKQPDSNVIVVEEEYPIFAGLSIGHRQHIVIKERKSVLQMKDNMAWIGYLNNKVERRTIYGRREYPVVWVSFPNPPITHVKIWIYDSTGNKSEPVPLEYGYHRMGAKKAIGTNESSVNH